MIRKDDIISEEVACVPSVDNEAPIEMSAEAEQAEKELEKIASADGDSAAMKTKNTSKNFAITLLFIAVNVIAVVLTALMEFSGGEEPIPFAQVWRSYVQNWGWLLGALVAVVVAQLLQAGKRYLFLRSTLNKKLPIISLNATLLCKYYDSITPLGSGGQPFEIYYLRKKGIPVGVASGVPLVSYALDRIAFVFVAFVVLIAYGFGNITTVIKILCVIGLVINAAIPFALLFFSVMPKTAEKIAGFVAKIAKALHLTKDAEKLKGKLTGSIKEYAECISYFIKKSKGRMILGFVLSILYFLALYSLPYFVIRMSGNSNIGWGEIYSLCVICYTSVTMLPTPGNSGGAELSFRSIFATYLQGGKLFWGIMSWRLFSYYLSIFVGLVLIIGQSIFKFTKSGKAELARAHEVFKRTEIRPKTDEVAEVREVAEAAQEEMPQAEEPAETAEDVGLPDYTPVRDSAPAITIHDEGEERIETIIDDGAHAPTAEDIATDSVEHVIKVEAVIAKDGVTVTEIKAADDNAEPQTDAPDTDGDGVACSSAESENVEGEDGSSSGGESDAIVDEGSVADVTDTDGVDGV